MPNYCNFDINIQGVKKNVQTFLNWLNADYEYSDGTCNVYLKKDDKQIPLEHHIGYRVFECFYDSEWLESCKEDEDVTVYANGYCAWSVYSCMFDGEHTYFNDKQPNETAITLKEACKLLNVQVELFSTETGFCFSEHYYINNKGEVIINEESEYGEFYISDIHSYDDFIRNNPDAKFITKKIFQHAKSNNEDIIRHCEWQLDEFGENFIFKYVN